MRTPTRLLSNRQIEFFRREGYLVIESLTTPAEAAFVGRVLHRLASSAAPRGLLAGATSGPPLVQILMPVLNAPELVDCELRANATAIARQLLGEAAIFDGEQALMKPAGHEVPTPWHQDEAYWDPTFDYTALSIWVALQETDTRNSCLWYLPRSHELGVLPHHHVGDKAGGIELEVISVERSGAVACVLPAGGAGVHGSRTLHYAGPNRTHRPRLAYSLGYSLPPRPRPVPRASPSDVAAGPARPGLV